MAHPGTRLRHSHPARALLGAFAALLLATPALAQGNGIDPPREPEDSIEAVNDLLRFVTDEDRAETILFPALIGMEDPPGVLTDPRSAALMAPDHPSWNVVKTWAEAPAQVAAIDALKEVTEFQSPYQIGLPYGDSAPQEFVDAGVDVDLGSTNLLATANFGYLDALQELAILVQVQATLQAAGGNVGESLDLLVRLTRLGRMTLWRVFGEEHYWGYTTMRLALERMRDVAYVYDENAIEADYLDAVEELDARDLLIGRIEVPQGDRHAALQMIVATIQFRGEPHPDQFAPTLARTASAGRELRLFSQAARWDAIAENHKGWYDSLDQLEGLYDDWMLRWKLSPHDSISEMTEYERMDKAHFAILDEVIGNLEPLFDERLNLRLELAGTRTALAVMAYHKRFRSWPSPLAAIRPHFISDIDLDPFDPSEAVKVDYLQYFVPIRDFRRNDREEPGPYTIEVISGGGTDEAQAMQAMANVLFAVVTEAIESLSDAELEQVGADQVIALLAQHDVNADNVREKYDDVHETIESIGGDQGDAALEAAMQRVAAERGLSELFAAFDNDVEDLQEDASQESPEEREENIRIWESTLRQERVQATLNRVRGGGNASAEEQRVFMLAHLIATFETVVEADIADAGGSFTITLDDSTFVLYSVGYNGTADWAKNVGPAGADILMWPPMLSLARDR